MVDLDVKSKSPNTLKILGDVVALSEAAGKVGLYQYMQYH